MPRKFKIVLPSGREIGPYTYPDALKTAEDVFAHEDYVIVQIDDEQDRASSGGRSNVAS